MSASIDPPVARGRAAARACRTIQVDLDARRTAAVARARRRAAARARRATGVLPLYRRTFHFTLSLSRSCRAGGGRPSGGLTNVR